MRISDWSSDVCSSELGADPFTQPFMRHRHHCDVGDCRIAMQRIFDFLRADILAPAHDNILFTAAHRREIAKFDPSEITRAEEAIGRAPCRERVCQYV